MQNYYKEHHCLFCTYHTNHLSITGLNKGEEGNGDERRGSRRGLQICTDSYETFCIVDRVRGKKPGSMNPRLFLIAHVKQSRVVANSWLDRWYPPSANSNEPTHALKRKECVLYKYIACSATQAENWANVCFLNAARDIIILTSTSHKWEWCFILFSSLLYYPFSHDI